MAIFLTEGGLVMNSRWWFALLSMAISCAAPAATPTARPLDLGTDTARTSYIIGVMTGRNLKRDRVELDLDVMRRGIEDGLAGTSRISEDDMRKFMSTFMGDLKRRTRVASDDNRNRAKAFMLQNKAKPGVVALPSGVQYRVLKEGHGRKPEDGSEVTVNYRGTLIDGTVFDKTSPGKPMTFKLSGLIAGWKEALKLMPAGSKWQLFIPPERGYGDHGAGMIGPNQALIFDVELVAVK
jgi:FKBP-type peptidyl-prolyl cis-trans isomerase